MSRFFFFLFILSAQNLSAQGFSKPESVDCDTLTNTWYVGNVTTHEILKGSPGGPWVSFASNINNGPYGIEVVGNRLYACNGGQIRGYQLSDGAQVFSINTGATFLNGITHDSAGFLYATDFSAKKIYKIDPAAADSWVFVGATAVTPNGIIFDQMENRLVFVSWGSNAKIMGVSLLDSAVTTLKTTSFSNIDGIASDRLGRFYVAHWGGNAVHRYDHDFSTAAVSITTGLSSPADIYYNVKTDTLAIPNSGNNTVKFIGLAPLSAIEEQTEPQHFKVFPNPAKGFFQVEVDQDKYPIEVQLQDITGKIVIQKIQIAVQGLLTLDVSQLPRGIYTYLIRGEQGTSVGKMILE
jgi:hypothetical protein